MADSSATGRIFGISTSGADIVGFDPARDKLDLGDVSVHNCIVVDTPNGVAFMDPWSGEMAVVVGVSLGQLTIDSFVPIQNDHLRQDLSGALAWEQGVTPAANTVYARSHEIGQIDRVAFDPATDVVDFRYFGTREQIYMSDSADGVIISNSGTGQALILLGVTKAELTVENFLFHSPQVYEDRVHLQLGFGPVPAGQVLPQGVPIAGTNDWPTQAGNGTPPSGETGVTTVIDWDYGSATAIAFDPATDKLDFGWFKAHEFSVAEVNGSTVITITGNNQTYTLTGVTLAELELNNIIALDNSARVEWQGLIESAGPAPGLPTLSVSDTSVAEGASGTSYAVFTVTLSAASASTVTVSYTTLNGTATAGQDYASTVGTLTFAPGETVKTIQVPVSGDTMVELNEAFTLGLSAPVNATIADGTATGTIVNDDMDAAPGTLPAISIADLSVSEGNGEHMHFMFLVTLDKASTGTVTVNYATASGTAQAGSDFASSTGTVTFAPGETSKMIHVDILGDTVVEPNETFTVSLSGPSGATIADGTAIGTILNDDSSAPPVATPALSIGDLTVSEGNGDHVHFMFTVTLDQPSTGTVSVNYATANGTALAGSDYVAGSGTLTFAPGETSKMIHVDILGDTVAEANETFTVSLSGPSGATIADGTAIGTILNDDSSAPPVATPALSIGDLTVSEGSGDHVHFMFTVTLDRPSTGTVSVNYATANGTALAGSDYVAGSGTLTFAPGETSKTIHVDILGDTVAEANETFTVSLSGPSGATIADGTATGTIVNDDAAAPATGGASVDYVVRDNWGAGFVAQMEVEAGTSALNGWVIEFDAGFTITSIWNAQIVSHVGTHYVIKNMSYNANVGAGKDTSFGFQATPGTGGTTATGFTINGVASGGSDPAPVLPALSVAAATIMEGDSGTKLLTFTVTLSAASTSAVSVAYATSNGTATAGSDYAAASGMLTFAPGETSKTIQVTVNGDTAVEGNETLNLTLSNASGATIATASAIGTITNDDVAVVLPTLAVADATVTEGNSGTKVMSFTVTLSAASTSAVSVAYATSNGTATAGSDYAAASGTLTFAPGETSKTIQVTVNGDTAVEGNETLNLTLSSPSGATLADGAAVGTITNDDVAPVLPTLAVADATVTEGNSGTKVMNFTVTLSAASTSAVSVAYATSNGTATAGSDYAASSGTLTFAPGETSKTIQVTVNGDTVVEGNETLNLTLSSPSGATIADGAAVGTISNDDTAPATGGAVDYQVSSSWGSGFTASMTVEGGASGLSGWVVEFDAGFTITNIWNAQIVSHVGTHYVIKNMSYNANVGAGKDTSFGFQATPGTGGTTAANFVLNGTPVDDGPAPVLPTLAVSDASIVEGNSGTSQLAFTVTLSAAATSAVTVAYATSNGTAQAGVDYTARSGTLTFAAGETSKVIYVPVTADMAVEANETVNLTLSAASGATIADATGVGTIVNDDVVLPSLSIADAAVTEGNAGTSVLTFTVSLSQAATGPVSVQFATGDGTATAGSDYGAASGTLTFAAGETVKTVQVVVNADSVVEASETLTVTLSSPSGATIADGSATGTILNDDVSGTEPVVNVSDTSVIEGDPATGAAAAGWLSTSGNQIIDASGNTVQLAGVNWFGFESTNFAPHGLWTRGYQEMMDQMVDLGFNTIRLPFSSEMLHTSTAPNGIDFSKNPDLRGLSAIEIMDKIVEYAGEIGLRIILDHHRSNAGAGTSDNGLWYNSEYTEAEWIDDWQMLAERYADAPAVIGADLHNEPHNGTWGGGGVNDWAAAAERAGNAIGDVNSNWLIFVEGVGSYDGNNYWWGGNLEGVRDRPIVLELDNKLVYSAHDYPNSIYNQPWFQSSDFADRLPAKFDEMWGYIYREGIAPVYIGEFGTKLEDPKDAPWFEAITAYIAGDFDNDGTIDIPEGDQGISWTFWSWNPNSGDTGGILGNDWTSVNTNKLAYLEPIMFDFATDVPGGEGSAGGDEVYATFIVSLTEASAEAVTVNYHTMAGSADASDFTPTSGTLTFAPGETSKTIQVAVKSDLLDEADESFSVMLTDASGAVIGIGTATATIRDDDTAASGPGTGAGTGSGSGSVEADLEALLAVVDSWNSGFNASVTIRNEGAATSGWQLEIDTPLTITSIWNAEIVSHDAEGYVIRNAAYNAAIGADQSVSFGFTVAGSYDPSQFELHI